MPLVLSGGIIVYRDNSLNAIRIITHYIQRDVKENMTLVKLCQETNIQIQSMKLIT